MALISLKKQQTALRHAGKKNERERDPFPQQKNCQPSDQKMIRGRPEGI